MRRWGIALVDGASAQLVSHTWMDAKTVIKGSLRARRAAFPAARTVNVSERDNIVDSDFVHIRGGLPWCDFTL